MKTNSVVTHFLVAHTLVAHTLVTHTLVTKALALRSLVTSMLVKYVLLTFTCLLVLGCAQQPDYRLATSHKQIKQVQILDPDAPERNDGIIATLDGNYGKKVIEAYQRSIYDMKSSRQMVLTGQ